MGALQQSIQWLRIFSEAKDRIDAGDFAGAMPLLEQALPISEELDVALKPDFRLAQTLERMAYANHKQGLLTEAEPLYRRALELADRYLLEAAIRKPIYENLGKLLSETGREDEAQALLAGCPIEEPEAAVAVCQIESIEQSMMRTLSNLAFFQRAHVQRVLSVMYDLIEHTENCFGTLSNEFADSVVRVFQCQSANTETKALPILQKALVARLSVGGTDKELASLGMDLAMFDQSDTLSTALLAKYRNPERFDDPINLSNSIRATIAAVAGEAVAPSPMVESVNAMSIEEADKIISDWLASQPAPVMTPPPMTKELRNRRLLPLMEKALALVQELEAEDPYPLGIVCVLSEKSRLHREMGEIAQALHCLELKIQVIAGSWGEAHEMMFDARKQFKELQQKK